MRYALFCLILLNTGLLYGQSFTQDIEVKSMSIQTNCTNHLTDHIPNKPIDALKNTDFTLTPKPIPWIRYPCSLAFSAAIFRVQWEAK